MAAHGVIPLGGWFSNGSARGMELAFEGTGTDSGKSTKPIQSTLGTRIAIEASSHATFRATTQGCTEAAAMGPCRILTKKPLKGARRGVTKKAANFPNVIVPTEAEVEAANQAAHEATAAAAIMAITQVTTESCKKRKATETDELPSSAVKRLCHHDIIPVAVKRQTAKRKAEIRSRGMARHINPLMYGRHGETLFWRWPHRTADDDVSPDDTSLSMRCLYHNQQACYREAREAVEAMIKEYELTCDASSTNSKTSEPLTPAPGPVKPPRAPSKFRKFLTTVAGYVSRFPQQSHSHRPAAIEKERRAKKERLRKERKRGVEPPSEGKITQKEIEELERLAGKPPGYFNEEVERQVEERLRAYREANATKGSMKRKLNASTSIPTEQVGSSQGASKRPRPSVPDIAVIPATPPTISPVESSFSPEQFDETKLMVPHSSGGIGENQITPIQPSAPKVCSANEIAAGIAQQQEMWARHALARKLGDPHRATPHIGMFSTPPKPNMFRQSAASHARSSLEVHGAKHRKEPAQAPIEVSTAEKIPDPVEPAEEERVLTTPANTGTVPTSPLAPAEFKASKKIQDLLEKNWTPEVAEYALKQFDAHRAAHLGW